MDRRHASCWLLPDAATRGALQGWIDALARRYEAPRFEAHVTLASGAAPVASGASAASPASVFPSALRAAIEGGVVLSTRGYSSSRTLTRAFVIELAPSPALEDTRRIAARWLGSDETKAFAPHVSLLYAELSEAEGRARIEDAAPLPPTLRFDGLALMTSARPIRSRSDIASWQVPYVYRPGPDANA